jgi:hypothetical protein
MLDETILLSLQKWVREKYLLFSIMYNKNFKISFSYNAVF